MVSLSLNLKPSVILDSMGKTSLLYSMRKTTALINLQQRSFLNVRHKTTSNIGAHCPSKASYIRNSSTCALFLPGTNSNLGKIRYSSHSCSCCHMMIRHMCNERPKCAASSSSVFESRRSMCVSSQMMGLGAPMCRTVTMFKKVLASGVRSVHTTQNSSQGPVHEYLVERDNLCVSPFRTKLSLPLFTLGSYESYGHRKRTMLQLQDFCSTSKLLPQRQYLHTLSYDMQQPSKVKSKCLSVSPRKLLHTLVEFNLENSMYYDYLKSLVDEFKALSEARLRGTAQFDQNHFLFLESVAMAVKELESAYAELADLHAMLSGELDKELQTMAKVDVDIIKEKIQDLEERLVDILVGPEPADENDVMLEVSAGVGGQEAMLFSAEIFDMYAGYASFKGWMFELVDREKNDLGGVRRASALVSGVDVYKHLKFEAGVHRVQRVPKTEKAGRVHTSTMTVAVLPQPSQIDISVSPKDLHIDTFRASGAGGQHVNKTESAVRITHKPSGIVAECQQERSQIKNKEKAMKILLSRLYQKQVTEQEAALRKNRKLQVGSAGRSEKIRTYNYSQDRITDHRGPITFYNVGEFLHGTESMDDLTQSLMTQSRLEALQAMVDQFVESQK